MKEQKPPPKRWFYSFRNAGGAPSLRSAKGSFELCGARLKELFEKSSLRNLKNFSAAVVFYLIGNFRAQRETSPSFSRSVRLWRFSYGKRRCSAAETESAFAVGKYIIIPPKADYHSREARLSFRRRRTEVSTKTTKLTAQAVSFVVLYLTQRACRT